MINGSVRMGKGAMKLMARYSQVNWALADQAMVSAVNFLTGVLLARCLGLREFGVFTMAWMAVLLVSGMQSALVALPMMSIGPKQSVAEAPVYYGSAFIQQCVVGLLSFILLLAGAFALDIFYPQWGAGYLALPASVAAVTFTMQDFLRRYFFTIGKPASAFINDTISYGGRIVLLAWLFYAGLGTSANALWVLSSAFALAALIGGVCVKGMARPGLARFREDVRRHWEFSRWLAPSTVMYWMTNNFIIVAVGAILGASSAGALRACQTLMGLTHIMFMGLNNVATPRASRIHNESGHKAFSRYIVKIGALVMGVTFAFAVVIAVDPGFWLSTVYGAEYMAYTWVVRGYALVYIVMSAVLPVNIGLRALEDTRTVFYANLSATVFILLSFGFIIKNYGVTGAVAGIFLSNAILLLISSCGLRMAFRKWRVEKEKLAFLNITKDKNSV